MWLAVVLLIIAGYLVHRAWRRRHPKVVQREGSYSEKLQQRLASTRYRGKSRRGAGTTGPAHTKTRRQK